MKLIIPSSKLAVIYSRLRSFNMNILAKQTYDNIYVIHYFHTDSFTVKPSGSSNNILPGGSKACQLTIMTSSNGNFFRAAGPLCGHFTSQRWIPLTKASDAELCFFYRRLNQRLSKQSAPRWFQTTSRSIWRHGNVCKLLIPKYNRTQHSATTYMILWIYLIGTHNYSNAVQCRYKYSLK